MSQFTKPLRVQQLDAKFWKLLEPVIYHVGSEDSSEIIIVPAGFVTDFASIPPFAWSIIGHPIGPYAQAAVVHDWNYQHPDKYSRRKCDQIFLEGLKILIGGWKRWWKRSTMYSLVRTFGWVGWNKYREHDSEQGD